MPAIRSKSPAAHSTSTSSVSKDSVDDAWKNGDFEITTSDNVKLRVASYYIFASRCVPAFLVADATQLTCYVLFADTSSVFRDAHELSDGGTPDVDGVRYKMSLYDQTIETADVVRLYLDLAVEGRLEMVDGSIPHMKELAHFLDKWNCKQAQRIMCFSLEGAEPNGKVDSYDAFIIAALAGDIQLCAQVLRSSTRDAGSLSSYETLGPRRYTRSPFSSKSLSSSSDRLFGGPRRRSRLLDQDNLEPIRNDNIWNPARWPSSMWGSGIPPSYLKAVARGFGDYLVGRNIAQAFLRHMDSSSAD